MNSNVTAQEWFALGERVPYDTQAKRILEGDTADSSDVVNVFRRVDRENAQDEEAVWTTFLPGFPDGSFGWAKVDQHMNGDGRGSELFVEYVGQGDSDKPADYPYGTMERADLVDCLSQTLEYTKARHQFGRPIASFQLVQQKLADAATALSQAQALAFQVGRLKESGNLHPAQISMAKYANTRAALEIARACRDLLGAAGITDDFSPLRHALNLETVHTYEGTQHMHQLVLGRHLTGLDAIS